MSGPGAPAPLPPDAGAAGGTAPGTGPLDGALGAARRPWAEAAPLAAALAWAVAFRAAAYGAMTAVAIWAERRPSAGGLPDLVLGALPYSPALARLNYDVWLFAYLPLATVFLFTEPRRWARYTVTGALVTLARALTLALTALGPPDPAHAGPGLGSRGGWEAWLSLVSPWAIFARGTAQAYLTKDLFFSGHTATTFLLLLYLWPRPRLRWLALAAHVMVVANVLLARLHYSIDVVGAWAVTFAIFALREWRPRPEALRLT
jgi:hypothetical protein